MTLFNGRLFTPRLCLRRVEEGDLALLVEWSRSRTANGPWLSPENLQPDRLRMQMETGALWNDMEKLFVIVERAEEQSIGTIHYWRPAGCEATAAMALKIALPGERGKGYGFEAQKYLISYLFDSSRVDKVEMHTDIDNAIQQKCLRRLGFELVDSLNYLDQQVERIGHLYRLTRAQYARQPIYQYHDL